MRAAVESDVTTREIVIRLVGGPVLDISEEWHFNPRKIRADRAVVTLINGKPMGVRISGGLLLKSGETSDAQRAFRNYSPDEDPPPWVQELAQAPTGTTEWTIEGVEDE